MSAKVDKVDEFRAAGVVTLRTGLIFAMRQARITTFASVDDLLEAIYRSEEGEGQFVKAYSEPKKAVRVRWSHNSSGWAVDLAVTDLLVNGGIPKVFLENCKKRKYFS